MWKGFFIFGNNHLNKAGSEIFCKNNFMAPELLYKILIDNSFKGMEKYSYHFFYKPLQNRL
jgi:5-formaminoimidazole-4-carboxamide-1-beta-D-ribofuranosyl 5'-monophosphate synthetase